MLRKMFDAFDHKTTTCNNMQQMIHKCCVLLGIKFGSFDRGLKPYCLPGGGFISHHQVLTATLKPLYGSQTLQLLAFTFLPQFEKILAKSMLQGVTTVIFQTRRSEKLET